MNGSPPWLCPECNKTVNPSSGIELDRDKIDTDRELAHRDCLEDEVVELLTAEPESEPPENSDDSDDSDDSDESDDDDVPDVYNHVRIPTVGPVSHSGDSDDDGDDGHPMGAYPASAY